MTMFEWNPFEEVQRLQNEMNRLFRGIGSTPLLESSDSKGKEAAPLGAFRLPLANVYENDKNVVAQFEIPGVDKDHIEVNVTDDHIEVKVEQKDEIEEDNKNFYRYESRCNQFYRRLPLPEGTDSAKAEAKYENGILKIEVPKSEKLMQKTKKLQIK